MSQFSEWENCKDMFCKCLQLGVQSRPLPCLALYPFRRHFYQLCPWETDMTWRRLHSNLIVWPVCALNTSMAITFPQPCTHTFLIAYNISIKFSKLSRVREWRKTRISHNGQLNRDKSLPPTHFTTLWKCLVMWLQEDTSVWWPHSEPSPMLQCFFILFSVVSIPPKLERGHFSGWFT